MALTVIAMIMFKPCVMAIIITVNESGLSQGQVAGIVLPILIITALAVGGIVAGVLVWKFQPWHNSLSKKGTKNDGESLTCEKLYYTYS